MKHYLSFLIVLLTYTSCFSQAIYEEKRYVPETDPLVLEKIEQWQGLKFGLMMHWGTYSQWGIVESWSLCPEEYSWCERTKSSDPSNYFTYKKEYEELQQTFNPVKFNPDDWAKAAKNAGMKYLVFTAKHHDGFCMYDTKYTDYKITSDACPFSTNPKSDVTKEIFDAFRKQDIWAGAYFSKPDWHVDSYWDPKYPPRDRNVNYNPADNPEKWQEFIDFTHNQMLELLTSYGKVDLMWLDGGWVGPKSLSGIESWYNSKLEEDKGYLKSFIIDQDINMDEFVEKARKKQPGIIMVDRGIHGKHQNYLTPENRVPEKALPYPWETCLTSTEAWSHKSDATYMTGHEGIQTLVDIVSKGGNLLLNIAPTPEGDWQEGAYQLLQEFANWMQINSEGIYNSKVLPPYKEENICMTQQDNGNAFFFYLCDEKQTNMPSEITIKAHQPKQKSQVTLLGYKKPLKWEKVANGFRIIIPKELQKQAPCNYVWTFKVDELSTI